MQTWILRRLWGLHSLCYLSCRNCHPIFNQLGFYGDLLGQSTCKSCPSGSSTLQEASISIIDCGCNQGTYGKAYLGFSCSRCPNLEGTTCTFNNSLPYVLAGYFSDPTNYTNVFKCIPSSACLETGTEEATSCGDYFIGANCGDCITGYRRRANACEECPPEITKWLILAAGFVGAAIVFYILSIKNGSIPVDFKIAFRALQLLAL